MSATTTPAQLLIQFRDARHDAERVAAVVCTVAGDTVTVAQLLGRGRKATTVRLRFVVAYILRYHLGHTCAAIGKAMERDHTTVVHATETVMDQAPRYDDLRHPYRAACAMLELRPHGHLLRAPEAKAQPRQRFARVASGETVRPWEWTPEQRRAIRQRVAWGKVQSIAQHVTA